MAEFRFDGDLSRNLNELPEKIRKAMYAACAFQAPRAEAYMKSNAPWTDRTGNARNGLRAKATPEGELVLYSTVSYQIWLEVRFSGRYAILGPALEIFGPAAMETLARLGFRGGV